MNAITKKLPTKLEAIFTKKSMKAYIKNLGLFKQGNNNKDAFFRRVSSNLTTKSAESISQGFKDLYL